MSAEITLNHTIVPSLDKVEAAKFYANIFGFDFIKEWGHFAVVNASSTLTLDFVTSKENFLRTIMLSKSVTNNLMKFLNA